MEDALAKLPIAEALHYIFIFILVMVMVGLNPFGI